MQDAKSQEYNKRYVTIVNLLLVVIVLSAIARRSFFASSLWLDETITAWVVNGSFEDAFWRSYNYQGQSPLYYLMMWLWNAFASPMAVSWISMESLFRIPSLGALLITAIVLWSFLRRHMDTYCATLAILFFITSDGIQKALSARPYAFALCASVIASTSLWSWLRSSADQATKRTLFVYAISIVSSFYFHYLFILLLPFHLLTVLFFGNNTQRKQFFLLLPIVSFSLVPGFFQLQLLSARKSELVFAAVPGVDSFIAVLLPLTLLVYLISAVLLALVFSPRGVRSQYVLEDEKALFFYCLGLWILPVFIFYLCAHLNVGIMFVERYFLWATVSGCLACAVFLSRWKATNARYVVLSAVFFLMIGRENNRTWFLEDWKSAAQEVQELRRTHGGDVPVVLSSGLVELDTRGCTTADNPLGQYVIAPAQVYPIPEPLLSISMSSTNELPQECMSRLRDQLPPRFIVISLAKSARIFDAPAARNAMAAKLEVITGKKYSISTRPDEEFKKNIVQTFLAEVKN